MLGNLIWIVCFHRFWSNVVACWQIRLHYSWWLEVPVQHTVQTPSLPENKCLLIIALKLNIPTFYSLKSWFYEPDWKSFLNRLKSPYCIQHLINVSYIPKLHDSSPRVDNLDYHDAYFFICNMLTFLF